MGRNRRSNKHIIINLIVSYRTSESRSSPWMPPPSRQIPRNQFYSHFCIEMREQTQLDLSLFLHAYYTHTYTALQYTALHTLQYGSTTVTWLQTQVRANAYLLFSVKIEMSSIMFTAANIIPWCSNITQPVPNTSALRRVQQEWVMEWWSEGGCWQREQIVSTGCTISSLQSQPCSRRTQQLSLFVPPSRL